jgi:hypothetical protein
MVFSKCIFQAQFSGRVLPQKAMTSPKCAARATGTHALPGDLCGSRQVQLFFDGLRYLPAEVREWA